MTVTITNLQPLIAILAGILILVVPRLLNYIVAVYLILIGRNGRDTPKCSVTALFPETFVPILWLSDWTQVFVQALERFAHHALHGRNVTAFE